jgi:hypothetical protein
VRLTGPGPRAQAGLPRSHSQASVSRTVQHDADGERQLTVHWDIGAPACETSGRLGQPEGRALAHVEPAARRRPSRWRRHLGLGLVWVRQSLGPEDEHHALGRIVVALSLRTLDIIAAAGIRGFARRRFGWRRLDLLRSRRGCAKSTFGRIRAGTYQVSAHLGPCRAGPARRPRRIVALLGLHDVRAGDALHDGAVRIDSHQRPDTKRGSGVRRTHRLAAEHAHWGRRRAGVRDLGVSSRLRMRVQAAGNADERTPVLKPVAVAANPVERSGSSPLVSSKAKVRQLG